MFLKKTLTLFLNIYTIFYIFRVWEDEIDKMRKEFFHLRPESSDFRLEGTGSPVRLPSQISSRVTDTDDGKAVIEKDDNGQPVFRVSKLISCVLDIF